MPSATGIQKVSKKTSQDPHKEPGPYAITKNNKEH